MGERWDRFHTDAHGYPKVTAPRVAVRVAADMARKPAAVARIIKSKLKKDGDK